MAKIISFTNTKGYKLRLTIDVSISLKTDGTISQYELNSDDPYISEFDLIRYLGEVATEASKGMDEIVKNNTRKKVFFTIFYYEGESESDFKFIISPSSYSNKDVATYVFYLIAAYINKK